jgi:hypothetical protein
MPQLSREFQSRAVATRFFRLSIYFNIAIRYLKANQANSWFIRDREAYGTEKLFENFNESTEIFEVMSEEDLL